MHWIDCWELWCEPKDLAPNFTQFFTECMRYPVKPTMAAIEKKSTGTALLSVLSDFRGLHIVDIERNKMSEVQRRPGLVTKTQRFLDCQPYIASKLISLPI